jgi:ornithine cyclodeaminase
VEDALGLETADAPSAAAAADGAHVVTLVTRSPRPFLEPADVGAGTHVNAVGAIGLDRAEFAPGLLSRCETVAVDDLAAAQAWSFELRAFYGTDPAGWSGAARLADLAGDSYRRPATADVTVFKAMGLGHADLSIAAFVYENAVLNGLGAPLPEPARSRPRLRSSLRSQG